MTNIFNFLSAESKAVVTALQCAQGELSQAELAYITGLDALKLHESLNQLMTTNVIRFGSISADQGAELTYNLGEIAREYVSIKQPAAAQAYKEIRRRIRDLSSADSEIRNAANSNRYSFFSFDTKSRGQILIAQQLSDAIRKSMEHKYSEALQIIDNARMLASDYFEVHRVAAIVNCAAGNYAVAEQCYEKAIELCTESAPLYFWFGSFLMRYPQDTDRAIEMLNNAEQRDPKEAQVKVEIARAYMFAQHYSDARIKMNEVLITRLPAWIWRKAWDLSIQVYHKEAEYQFRTKDHLACGKTIMDFISLLPKIPREAVDRYTVATIIRICKLLEKALIPVIDADTIKMWTGGVSKLKEYLSDLGVAYGAKLDPSMRGVILRIKPAGFGFILGEDNEEYYFHLTAIKDQYHTTAELIDTAVEFDSGYNQQGTCAVNIRFSRQFSK